MMILLYILAAIGLVTVLYAGLCWLAWLVEERGPADRYYWNSGDEHTRWP